MVYIAIYSYNHIAVYIINSLVLAVLKYEICKTKIVNYQFIEMLIVEKEKM